jgi:hypothetical protein
MILVQTFLVSCVLALSTCASPPAAAATPPANPVVQLVDDPGASSPPTIR